MKQPSALSELKQLSKNNRVWIKYLKHSLSPIQRRLDSVFNKSQLCILEKLRRSGISTYIHAKALSKANQISGYNAVIAVCRSSVLEGMANTIAEINILVHKEPLTLVFVGGIPRLKFKNGSIIYLCVSNSVLHLTPLNINDLFIDDFDFFENTNDWLEVMKKHLMFSEKTDKLLVSLKEHSSLVAHLLVMFSDHFNFKKTVSC